MLLELFLKIIDISSVLWSQIEDFNQDNRKETGSLRLVASTQKVTNVEILRRVGREKDTLYTKTEVFETHDVEPELLLASPVHPPGQGLWQKGVLTENGCHDRKIKRLGWTVNQDTVLSSIKKIRISQIVAYVVIKYFTTKTKNKVRHWN